MHIISRPEWGSTQPDGFGSRSVGSLDKWLHHTATKTPAADLTQAQESAIVRGIEKSRPDLGSRMPYTFLVFPSGRVYQGHSINRIGAHTAGHNSKSVGISLVGNYSTSGVTTAMFAAVVSLLRWGVEQKWWNYPTLNGGHRDTKPTQCPGNNAYPLIPGINQAGLGATEVANPLPIPPITPPPAPAPGKLDVDGAFGTGTTKEFQRALGVDPDGVLSSQYPSVHNKGLLTAQWDTTNPQGSLAVARFQRFLHSNGHYNGKFDGLFGPGTITGTQNWLGTRPDGTISIPDSSMVRALQVALNEGRVHRV